MPFNKRQSQAVLLAYLLLAAGAIATALELAHLIGLVTAQSQTNCQAIRAMNDYTYVLATTSRRVFKSSDTRLLAVRQRADKQYLDRMGTILRAANCIDLRR